MQISEFIANLEKIYGRIEAGKNQVTCVHPDLISGLSGYLIAFRHPNSISDQVGSLSEKIADLVPAITYDSASVHTTIATYQSSNKFSPEKQTLDNLCSIVRETEQQDFGEIEFKKDNTFRIFNFHPNSTHHSNK